MWACYLLINLMQVHLTLSCILKKFTVSQHQFAVSAVLLLNYSSTITSQCCGVLLNTASQQTLKAIATSQLRR